MSSGRSVGSSPHRAANTGNGMSTESVEPGLGELVRVANVDDQRTGPFPGGVEARLDLVDVDRGDRRLHQDRSTRC